MAVIKLTIRTVAEGHVMGQGITSQFQARYVYSANLCLSVQAAKMRSNTFLLTDSGTKQ